MFQPVCRIHVPLFLGPSEVGELSCYLRGAVHPSSILQTLCETTSQFLVDVESWCSVLGLQ